MAAGDFSCFFGILLVSAGLTVLGHTMAHAAGPDYSAARAMARTSVHFDFAAFVLLCLGDFPPGFGPVPKTKANSSGSRQLSRQSIISAPTTNASSANTTYLLQCKELDWQPNEQSIPIQERPREDCSRVGTRCSRALSFVPPYGTDTCQVDRSSHRLSSTTARTGSPKLLAHELRIRTEASSHSRWISLVGSIRC
jgi:hypothetical protein